MYFVQHDYRIAVLNCFIGALRTRLQGRQWHNYLGTVKGDVFFVPRTSTRPCCQGEPGPVRGQSLRLSAQLDLVMPAHMTYLLNPEPETHNPKPLNPKP